MRVAYPRPATGHLSEEKDKRVRDLDPQLVWRGKDEQDRAALVVHAPPLYIQEKVQPKALIDDLRRQTEAGQAEAAKQGSGFTPARCSAPCRLLQSAPELHGGICFDHPVKASDQAPARPYHKSPLQ